MGDIGANPVPEGKYDYDGYLKPQEDRYAYIDANKLLAISFIRRNKKQTEGSESDGEQICNSGDTTVAKYLPNKQRASGDSDYEHPSVDRQCTLDTACYVTVDRSQAQIPAITDGRGLNGSGPGPTQTSAVKPPKQTGVSRQTLCVVAVAFLVGVVVCVGGILVWRYVIKTDSDTDGASDVGTNTPPPVLTNTAPMTEKPTTIPTATAKSTTPFVLEDCPAGYVRSDEFGSCYRLYSSQLTWSDARSLCESEGSYLLEIQSEEEFYFLITSGLLDSVATADHAWTGARRLDADTFVWDLSRNVLDTNAVFWFRGKPDNQNGQEDVVAMMEYYTFRFDDLRRGLLGHPFCKQKPGMVLPPRPTADITVSCPAGYVRSDEFGSCYRLHSSQINWSEARSLCLSEGSYLLEIESDEEFFFLTTSELLESVATADHVWTGGRLINSDTFVWDSSRNVLATEAVFWYRDKPNNQNGNEDVVAMMEYYTFRFDDLLRGLLGHPLCKQKLA